MATAVPPPRPMTDSSDNRTVVTIATLVAIMVAIVLLAIFGKHRSPRDRLEQIHLQSELQRSGHRARRKQPQRRGLSAACLEHIPVARYGVPSYKIRQTRSLDLETGKAYEAQSWTLAQSQQELKTMHVEMVEGKTKSKRSAGGALRTRPETTFEQQECPICTQVFKDNDLVRVLVCGHIHHKNCIDPWLLCFSPTCPVCRVCLDASQSFALSDGLPQRPEPAVVVGNTF